MNRLLDLETLCKSVFAMHKSGMTCKEIGKALGIAESSIRMLLKDEKLKNETVTTNG